MNKIDYISEFNDDIRFEKFKSYPLLTHGLTNFFARYFRAWLMFVHNRGDMDPDQARHGATGLDEIGPSAATPPVS